MSQNKVALKNMTEEELMTLVQKGYEEEQR